MSKVISKQGFIDEHLTNSQEKILAERLFELARPYEIVFASDICEWNWSKLVVWYKYIPNEVVALDIIYHILFRYIQSFNPNAKSIKGKSEIDLLKSSDTNGWVYSPESLSYWMGDIPIRVHRKDIAVKCVMWLAYSGVTSLDKCLLLKTEDIFNEYVTINGEAFYVYEGGMKELLSLQGMAKKNNSELLFKFLAPDGDIKSTLKNEISTVNRMINGISLKYTNIRRSGIYYRAYKDELNGVMPNFKVQAKLDLLETGNKAIYQRVNNRTRLMNLEYGLWKKVFENK